MFLSSFQSRPALTLQTEAVSFNFKFTHSIHSHWIHSGLDSAVVQKNKK